MRNNHLSLLLLALIFLFGLFIRVFKLGAYPVNLSHDEVSQLYDAVSIKETGMDIHGNRYPFIFPSIGDFKPPFYTYATIPFLYVFGNHDYVIRIVGALSGSLIPLAVYFFSRQMWKDKQIALFTAFFCAITPFEIHFSRKGFEGVTGVLLIILGFGLLVKYINTSRKIFFTLGSLVLALSMFVYFSYAILVPLFYLFFLILILIKNKKIDIFGFILFVWILSILILLIVNDSNSANRTKAVAITQDPVLREELSQIEKNGRFSNIQQILVISKYASYRYLDQINPTFLFVNGLDLTNQDPVDSGMFYYFQFPLMILGLLTLTKVTNRNNIWQLYLLVFITIVGLVPSGLTFESHSPHRSLIAYTLINLVVGFGGYALMKSINKFHTKKTVFGVYILLTLILFWHISYFGFNYLVSYPIDKSEYTQYPYKKVALISKDYYNFVDKIIFDPRFGKDNPWTGGAVEYYLAYYSMFPVENMQKEYKISDNGEVKSFGKFEIRSLDWKNDKKLHKTLVIASPWVIDKESFDDSMLVTEIRNYQNTITDFYVIMLD